LNFKQTSFSSFFPLPKSIFHIGLGAEEIAVYAYLMYCEDRETYQCYPSYSTIGEAVGMSKNTVKKYVDELRKKGLVETQYTTVTTKDGRTHNGSLLYTILPIEQVEEAYFQKQLRLQYAKKNIQTKLEKHEKAKEKSYEMEVKSETIAL
jgi:predicted transcriptional regulator